MVTDLQIRRLCRLDRQGLTRTQAAAKAGPDDKTARKYRRLGRLPSEVRMEHTWRTRANPFAEVWPRIEEQLTLDPGLEAGTVFDWLQRKYGAAGPGGWNRPARIGSLTGRAPTPRAWPT